MGIKKFLVGDICTFNRFECRVEAVNEPEEKVTIAFAVFVNDERTFDSNDTKEVPVSRVKLVQRSWTESLYESIRSATSPSTPARGRESSSLTPSFSARRKNLTDQENSPPRTKSPLVLFSSKPKKKVRKQSFAERTGSAPTRRKSRPEKKIVSIFPDSYLSSDRSETSPVEPKPRRRSRVAIVPDSYVSSNWSGDSDSSSSSSSSSSDSSPLVRRKKRSVTRVSVPDESPIPIVPDSFVSDDDGSSVHAISVASDSQEGDHMRSLALQYEKRAKASARSSWTEEVCFDWDPKKNKIKLIPELARQRHTSTASSFIIQDTPLPLSDTPRKTVESLWIDFSNLDPSLTAIDTVRSVWKYVDELFAPMESLGELFRFLNSFLGNLNCGSNIASEARMAFTQSSCVFVTFPGWLAGVVTVARVTARFKRSLLGDFLSKIAEKCSNKFESKIGYIAGVLMVMRADPELIGLLSHDTLIATSMIKQLLAQYEYQNMEGRDLIEFLVSTIISQPRDFLQKQSLLHVPELLPVFGALLGCLCPGPSDLIESSNWKLNGEFCQKLSRFIGLNLPSSSYLPMLMKGGGFLPPRDIGQQRIDFSKHRGLSFYNVVKDKGFCDWSERITDPSSSSFVDWIDFILWTRQVGIIGVRSVRADVELIRLSNDFEKIDLWIVNRALTARRAIDFFSSIPTAREHTAYAQCMYEVFRRIEPAHLEPLTEPLGRPRGEIVKEFFRPLLKLAAIAPSWKQRIVDAIVHVRADTYGVSPDDARNELISLHSLVLS